MRALPTVLVLAFLVLAPAASGAVPGLPGGDEEVVSSHGFHELATQRTCSSHDPVAGVVATDLTSRIRRVEDPSGMTLTIHLDEVPTEPSCGAIDLQLATSVRWPGEEAPWTAGGFTATCGATGAIGFQRAPEYVYAQAYFESAPAACGLPFEAPAMLVLYVQPLAPETGLACVAVLIPACVGASTWTYSQPPCEGGRKNEQFTIGAAGFALLAGAHGCWTGEEEGRVGDGLGLAGIRATRDSCTLHVGDFFGGPAQRSVACPQAVGDAVFGVGWAELLP